MTRKIFLTNGGTVLVDDEDYDFLNQFNWRAKVSDGTKGKITHAVRDVTLGNRKVTVRMHRLIAEARHDQRVEHINQNGLDNRRRNLQTRTVHPWTGRPGQAGFKGVHQTASNEWTAKILFAGTEYELATTNDPAEAARVYDDAARKLYGTSAVTNF